jgi:hypothetical protein
LLLKYLRIEITLGVVGIYICNAPALFSNLPKDLREIREILSGQIFHAFDWKRRELAGNA